MLRRHSRGIASIRGSGGRISWIRSNNDSAYDRRIDRVMGHFFRGMVWNGIGKDSMTENLGQKPFSRQFALGWSCPEALELCSNWEYLELANPVLCRKWNPTNRDRGIWQE